MITTSRLTWRQTFTQNYKLQITNYNKEFWKKIDKNPIYTSYYIIIYI
ncbi:hypothetical protein SAMN04487902_102286 [Prevotella sp. ne3005]|nr:hypothetical protein SAMN04487902_102286 [Prevotella sp. ne3005]